LTRWLSYIPAAVLASLLGPALFAPNGELEVGTGNIFLLAAVPTLLAAWRSRGLFAPVAVGMLVVALTRWAN
jgi:branched-subunit amino acid transport protein